VALHHLLGNAVRFLLQRIIRLADRQLSLGYILFRCAARATLALNRTRDGPGVFDTPKVCSQESLYGLIPNRSL